MLFCVPARIGSCEGAHATLLARTILAQSVQRTALVPIELAATRATAWTQPFETSNSRRPVPAVISYLPATRRQGARPYSKIVTETVI